MTDHTIESIIKKKGRKAFFVVLNPPGAFSQRWWQCMHPMPAIRSVDVSPL
ncbi:MULTISPECIES: hypothetical protein [Xanthomonas]|uniref:Uncharacterized protein n=1 Tax=Xanthomonas cucurbitae TaxID=56453 RepID=A0ABY7YHG7_9XANT|nr:hypothetical protein [Xanthomonas cucurbitae]WDM69450.1 hypothetical protein K6981_09655 [Xanthomonas cucurbitae]WDM73323.1 hypothetical protein K6978_09625 [Xanthomonas cucurbitae]WDM74020.1 hypothetical protein K6982_11190 [Xanthomonas cucurbitae]